LPNAPNAQQCPQIGGRCEAPCMRGALEARCENTFSAASWHWPLEIPRFVAAALWPRRGYQGPSKSSCTLTPCGSYGCVFSQGGVRSTEGMPVDVIANESRMVTTQHTHGAAEAERLLIILTIVKCGVERTSPHRQEDVSSYCEGLRQSLDPFAMNLTHPPSCDLAFGTSGDQDPG
jgi:hypothetical protein